MFYRKFLAIVAMLVFALFFSGGLFSDGHKKDMKTDKSERVKKRGDYFSSWDKNGDGYLESSEFLGMIRSQQGTPPWEKNPEWTPESQLESRMKKRDLNGDGLLSKEEFMKPVTWGKKK
ncbi:MAG: hypothetical protein CBC09_02315 [Cellvibrionales bacterium TMED49]|nr:MAG: hypothetical protein CBC09_02315 [Cellvibrionales bacterium TMED49]